MRRSAAVRGGRIKSDGSEPIDPDSDTALRGIRELSVVRAFRILFAGLMGLCLAPVSAGAWQQFTLPEANPGSQTAFIGHRAPISLGAGHWRLARATKGGVAVWESTDAGASWQSVPLMDAGASDALLLDPTHAISWGPDRGPIVHGLAGGGWQPLSARADWPLPHFRLIDARIVGGEVWALVTVPARGHLVEGSLKLCRWNSGIWSAPVELAPQAGAARIAVHPGGRISVLFAERAGSNQGVQDWRIVSRSSLDGGGSWSAPAVVASGIVAPLAQEAAVQLDAVATGPDTLALAFTGWAYQPHSQLWVKQLDLAAGTPGAAALIPDAGDMVFEPSLAVRADGRLVVVWQQRVGMDLEIYLSEQDAAGAWSASVNVSSDPLHLDRDPALGTDAGGAMLVAHTRADRPGVREYYRLSIGHAGDPSLDTDGDGMPDAEERGQDVNGDGIDDALSAQVATWADPNGRFALVLEDGIGSLTRVQALATESVGLPEPGDALPLTGLLAFDVVGLAPGATSQVRLVTPMLLPEDAAWLKMNAAGLWRPTPAPVWVDADGHALHIVLTDGGHGDEDGTANGRIHDPGMIGAPLPAPAPTGVGAPAGDGGGGGCLVRKPDDPAGLAALMPAALLALALLLAECRRPRLAEAGRSARER